MALELTPTVLFFGTVSLLQLALAYFIIVTRPRDELSWVFALLFAFNAAFGFANVIQSGYTETAVRMIGRRAAVWFDPLTALLILYLSFIYPERPKWAQGMAARIAVPASLIAFSALFLWIFVQEPAPYLTRGQGRSDAAIIFQDWAPAVAWIVVLARWSYLLPLERSPVRRRQFQLVFAAFGIRAAHLATFVALDYIPSGFVPDRFVGHVWTVLIYLGVAALIYALVRLLRARNMATLEARNAIAFVLVFLLFGIMEGFLSRVARLTTEHLFLFVYFDVYAVRPALVWFAILRFQLFDSPRAHRRTTNALFGSLAGLGLWLVINPVTANPLYRGAATDSIVAHGLAITVAALIALGLTFVFDRIVTAALKSFDATPVAAAGEDDGAAGSGAAGRADADIGQSVERYILELENMIGRGQYDAHRAAALEPLRARLGIGPEQHEALVRAVRSRWQEEPQGLRWDPGETIHGRYRIDDLLGEGGEGSVYLATDNLSGKRVVLKRLRAPDPAQRRAQLREAYAAGQLDHPHIVPLLATERVGEENVLVYEHIPGGSLHSRLADGPRMTVEEAVRVGMQVLDALALAHERRIVHRDVKPANILFDEAGNARLTDFGSAHLSPTTQLAPQFGAPTLTGVQPGTVRYMSPEQARGLPVDASSDIYSAAAVIFEMLTDQPLVPTTMTEYEQRRQIVEGPQTELPASIPPPVAQVLRAALDKDPARRWSTAGAFREALGRSVIEHAGRSASTSASA